MIIGINIQFLNKLLADLELYISAIQVSDDHDETTILFIVTLYIRLTHFSHDLLLVQVLLDRLPPPSPPSLETSQDNTEEEEDDEDDEDEDEDEDATES